MSLGWWTVEERRGASSDKAYGDHDELPYREDFPLQPRYPYDASKACADMIARSYAHTYSLPVAVTRLANIYGPGDVNWSRLVPDTARALAAGERPVIRSDGTRSATTCTWRTPSTPTWRSPRRSTARQFHGRAWNAGWGKPVKVVDLVRRLIEVSGARRRARHPGEGTPHGEIDRQYLDSTRDPRGARLGAALGARRGAAGGVGVVSASPGRVTAPR